MIQINKLESGKYMVSNVAKNGRLLKPSEVVNRRRSAINNIMSELKNCYHNADFVYYQDNTGKIPLVYRQGGMEAVGKVVPIKPQKIYKPK